LGTPDTGQRQTKKHNTEILSTLGTPDTGQRQTNKNTTQRYCQHWVHQTQDRDKQTKTQYRDTVNIGYTRYRTKTNKQKTQYRDTVNIGYTRHRTKTNKKTQYIDTVNFGYTRHRTETNKQKHNTEILSTLGTPDTGQRQTNKKHNT
jgi:hypothetical protein